jgi:electron transport complex protein RnfB
LRGGLRAVGLGALALCLGPFVLGRRVLARIGSRLCTICPDCPGADACRYLPPHLPQTAEVTTTVWQLDPAKCIQCGRCATNCVLNPSAVKCVHGHALCGYCRLCFGYFQPGSSDLTANAENELCPAGAIKRTFVEPPYYEYTIDESLCFACGKCVKGCNAFGNGSLFLQVRHDICVNCNECSIARACPSDAFRRVPVGSPYILKGAVGVPGEA